MQSNLRPPNVLASPLSRDDRSNNKDDNDKVNVAVAVRVRPLNDRELGLGGNERDPWIIEDNEISSSTIQSQKFIFDRVFIPEHENSHVYDTMARSLVQSALEGFNATIFAYGQTASGKTYTMQGIIQFAIKDLFNYVSQNSESNSWVIKMTYVELYQEEIRDLLCDGGSSTSIRIRENLAGQTVLENVKEVLVVNHTEALLSLEKGESASFDFWLQSSAVHIFPCRPNIGVTERRQVGSTNMNMRSSRSHAILTFDRGADKKSKASVRCARLNLVDLAGSECVAHTGAVGLRLREGAYINRSLLALTSVIAKLTSHNPRERMHIPYRDSKLTRILQSSLGGNAKTSIICNVTPFYRHADETLSTLKFAFSAKTIKNKPKVNMIADTQSADVYKETIKALEDRLAVAEAKNDKMDYFSKILGILRSSSKRPHEDDNGPNKRVKIEDEKAAFETVCDRVQELTVERAATMERLASTLEERDSLDEDLRKANAEIEEKNLEIERLQEDLAAVQQTLYEHQSLLSSLEGLSAQTEKKLLEMQSGRACIDAQITELKCHCNALETDLASREETLKRYESEIGLLQASLVELQAQRDMCTSAELDLELLQAEHRSTLKTLEEEQKRVQGLHQQIECLQDARNSVDNLSARVTELQEERNALQSKLGGLEQSTSTEIRVLHEECDTRQRRLAEVDHELFEAKQRLQEQQDQINSLTSSVERNAGLLERSKSACEEYVSVMEEQKLELQELKTELAERQAQIQGMQQNRAEFEKKSNFQIQHLTTECERLQDLNRSTEAQLDQLGEVVDGLQTSLSVKEETIVSLTAEVGRLQALRESLQGDVQRLETFVADQEAESGQLVQARVAELETLQGELARLEEQQSLSDLALKAAHEELSRKVNEIVRLEATLNDQQDLIAKLTAEMESGRCLLTDKEHAHNAIQERDRIHISDLKQELRASKASVSSLQQEISEQDEIISSKSAAILHLETSLSNMKATLSEKENDGVARNHELKSLRESSLKAQTLIASLTSDISVAKEEISAQQQARHNLELVLEETVQHVNLLQSQLAPMKEQLGSFSQQLIGRDDSISAMQSRLDNNLCESENRAIENMRLIDEINRLRTENATLSSAGSLLEAEKSALQIALAESRENLERIELDRSSLRTLQQNLSRDLKRHLDTIQAMQEESTALQKQHQEQLKREAELLDQQLVLEDKLETQRNLHTSTVSDLQDSIRELKSVSAELAAQKQRVATLTSAINEHQQTIETFSKETTELTFLRDEQAGKLKVQELQLLSLQQAYDEQTSRQTELSDRLKEVHKRATILERERNQLESSVKEKSDSLAILTAQDTALRHKVEALEMELSLTKEELCKSNNELQNTLAREEMSSAEFADIRAQLEASISSLHETITNLEVTLAAVQKECSTKSQVVAETSARLRDATNLLEAREATIVANEETVKSLRLALNEQRDITTGLEASLVSAQGEKADQAKALATLEDQILSLQASLAEQRHAFELQVAERTRLAQESEKTIAELRVELERVISLHSEAEGMLKEVSETLEHERTAVGDLRNENMHMQGELDACRRELVILHSSVAELQQDLGRARMANTTQVESMQENVTTLHGENQALHEEVGRLTEIEKQNARVISLANEATEGAQADLQASLAKTNQLQEQIEQLTRQVANGTSDLRSARQRLSISETELATLKADINSLHQAKSQAESSSQAYRLRMAEMETKFQSHLALEKELVESRHMVRSLDVQASHWQSQADEWKSRVEALERDRAMLAGETVEKSRQLHQFVGDQVKLEELVRESSAKERRINEMASELETLRYKLRSYEAQGVSTTQPPQSSTSECAWSMQKRVDLQPASRPPLLGKSITAILAPSQPPGNTSPEQQPSAADSKYIAKFKRSSAKVPRSVPEKENLCKHPQRAVMTGPTRARSRKNDDHPPECQQQ